MKASTLSLVVCACMGCSAAVAQQASHDHGHSNNLVYPDNSRPFGKSMSTWAERSTQWLYAQPYESNPFFDETGENCAVGQRGPVWYLAPFANAMMDGTYSRSCTIPKGKSILLAAAFYSNTYPCPDPTFEPAPGQSLYRFLRNGADVVVDTINRVEVSVDGKKVKDGLDYRFYSENLYSIKGDASLVSTYDNCITTTWQPAIIDGYYMMFKPLKGGRHTIKRRITTTNGSDTTYIYNLYIQ